MNKRSILTTFLSISAILLGGCASTNGAGEAKVEYNPNTQSRIRLFGQNGGSSIMYSGIDCQAGNEGEKTNVGGGLGESFVSFLRMDQSETLGIPQTEATQSLAKRDGILSKAFYKEFAIPAEKPVNLQLFPVTTPGTTPQKGQRLLIIESNSCYSPAIASFIPEKGKDYEILGRWDEETSCPYPVVLEITQIDNQVQIKEVQTSEAIKCK